MKEFSCSPGEVFDEIWAECQIPSRVHPRSKCALKTQPPPPVPRTILVPPPPQPPPPSIQENEISFDAEKNRQGSRGLNSGSDEEMERVVKTNKYSKSENAHPEIKNSVSYNYTNSTQSEGMRVVSLASKSFLLFIFTLIER